MPVKKIKPVSNGHSQLFVVLHDEKTSRHFMAEWDGLVFSKRDNLKPGTYATFTGNGERSSRFKGVVVLSG